MKKLYFVRHAKSSWSDFSQKDIDRPLNKRGHRDAPIMADFMKTKGLQPDLIISSPALRALTTAKVFSHILNYSQNDISINAAVYEASLDDILEVVSNIPDDKKEVMIFGHNPTFTNLANYFNPDEYIPNMPTCGIAGIQADVEKWLDFDKKTGKLFSFNYPKGIDYD